MITETIIRELIKQFSYILCITVIPRDISRYIRTRDNQHPEIRLWNKEEIVIPPYNLHWKFQKTNGLWFIFINMGIILALSHIVCQLWDKMTGLFMK